MEGGHKEAAGIDSNIHKHIIEAPLFESCVQHMIMKILDLN